MPIVPPSLRPEHLASSHVNRCDAQRTQIGEFPNPTQNYSPDPFQQLLATRVESLSQSQSYPLFNQCTPNVLPRRFPIHVLADSSYSQQQENTPNKFTPENYMAPIPLKQSSVTSIYQPFDNKPLECKNSKLLNPRALPTAKRPFKELSNICNITPSPHHFDTQPSRALVNSHSTPQKTTNIITLTTNNSSHPINRIYPVSFSCSAQSPPPPLPPWSDTPSCNHSSPNSPSNFDPCDSFSSTHLVDSVSPHQYYSSTTSTPAPYVTDSSIAHPLDRRDTEIEPLIVQSTMDQLFPVGNVCLDLSDTKPELSTSAVALTFTQASSSDEPMVSLEELLARSSIDDVYTGPVRGKDGKLVPLDPDVRTVNESILLSYSSPSSAFSPPGVQIATGMWSIFVSERLSHCNHRIQGMNMETLRQCLYEHGLNQLGSLIILRRRLQEFVRRVRDALSIGVYHSDLDQILAEFDSNSETAPSVAVAATAASITTVQSNNVPNSLPGVLNTSGYQSTRKGSVSRITPKTVNLRKSVILAPDTFYSYLLIIDLEATCDLQERGPTTPEYPHEIIEFPILLYCTRSRRCVGVFHAYCKPQHKPELTTFCTNLTQISQDQVNNAQPFTQVLRRIENWLFNKHRLNNVRCAIVCDCSADMAKFMRIQCRLEAITLPSWASVWINLTKAFRTFYKLPSRHRVRLGTMLQDLNLSFIGRQHRGLDDAINILRVTRTLLADGCLLRVNERVDLSRAPTYVASVTRSIAEITSGLMGSRLDLLSRKSRSSPASKADNGNSKDNFQKRMPSSTNIPEDQRQSLLWLANVQKNRIPKD